MSAGYPFVAGYWEQYAEEDGGDGLVIRSKHRTRSAARAAAVRYARELSGPNCAQTGGALSWAGGFREGDGGEVSWVDARGERASAKEWLTAEELEATDERGAS